MLKIISNDAKIINEYHERLFVYVLSDICKKVT